MRIFSLGFWKVGYVLTTKVQEVWFFTSLSHIKKISHSFWHKVHSNNSFWIRHLQLLVITLKFCKDLRIIRIKLLITWPEFAKNNMILRICILLTYVCYVCYVMYVTLCMLRYVCYVMYVTLCMLRYVTL